MKIIIESGFVSINGYGLFIGRRDASVWSFLKTEGCLEFWLGHTYIVMDKPWPHPPMPAI